MKLTVIKSATSIALDQNNTEENTLKTYLESCKKFEGHYWCSLSMLIPNLPQEQLTKQGFNGRCEITFGGTV